MITRAHLVVVAFALALCGWGACGPVTPQPIPPSPVALGGSPGAGGSTVAGSAGLAGQDHVAGTAGAAGTSSGSGGAQACPDFVAPTCNRATRRLSKAERAAFRSQLTGWHRDPSRAKTHRWQPRYAVVESCSRFWRPNHQKPFEQRRGSCTANAVGGVLSTEPFTGLLTQDDVDETIYPIATQIDPFPGTWPPNDTGSNGASAWRAAVQLGYTSIPSTPITSLEELQSAMQHVSCVIGIDWYESMFEPTSCGELQIAGAIAGGHALHGIAIDLKLRKLWVRNSWGPTWGLSRGDEVGGYAYLSFGTLQRLMNAGAEIDCPAYPPRSP